MGRIKNVGKQVVEGLVSSVRQRTLMPKKKKISKAPIPPPPPSPRITETLGAFFRSFERAKPVSQSATRVTSLTHLIFSHVQTQRQFAAPRQTGYYALHVFVDVRTNMYLHVWATLMSTPSTVHYTKLILYWHIVGMICWWQARQVKTEQEGAEAEIPTREKCPLY